MKATEAILIKHNAVWTTFTAFSDLVTAFQNTNAEITALISVQTQPTQGVTKGIAKLQNQTIAETLVFAAKLKAYAIAEGLSDLEEKYTLAKTELEKLRDTEIHAKALSTHDEALALLASLAPYNVTALLLTDFKTLIDTYATVMQAPENRINEKKIAKQNLSLKLNQNTQNLKTLDGLILQYRTTATQFYNEYTEARKIIDIGHRKTRLGLFVELEDGVDSTGVVVVITKGIKNYTQTVRSTDHKAYFESILVGTYTITIHHPGYQPWTGTINIKPGILNTATAKLML